MKLRIHIRDNTPLAGADPATSANAARAITHLTKSARIAKRRTVARKKNSARTVVKSQNFGGFGIPNNPNNPIINNY